MLLHKPLSPTQSRTRVNHPPNQTNSKCMKVKDAGEEGRERRSLAWWVTSRLYCTLRGTLVITPLTESSARSGPPHLLSLPLLCSSFTQQPNASYRLPTHIQRHIGASRDWQCLQTLKHMSTYTQTHTFALQGWQWNKHNITVLYLSLNRNFYVVMRTLNAVERLMTVTICKLKNCCI